MQIFFLSQPITVALCFVVWPIIQIAAAAVVRAMPESFFCHDNIVFSAKNFEDEGRFYERYFNIRAWKKYLPDGSVITGVGLKKKRMENLESDTLRLYVVESCRAELIHLLAIPPFIVFGLFCPPEVIFYMLVYSLAVNLPCFITQRYNRPRVLRVLKRRDCITNKKVA